MKIYTKNGDAGKTNLLGKNNVYKNDTRVSAYGTIDELNSIIGICIATSKNIKLKIFLKNIQYNLFLIGSYLADVNQNFITHAQLKILSKETNIIEDQIDEMEKNLQSLKNFILPGGSLEASYIHLARTVTRRVEREIVKVHKKEKINLEVLKYVNRLSDYFFVLARNVNKSSKIEETIWKIK